MKVAIVGGGIGGLTAAIALTQKGMDVEVLEQAPAVEAVGASLQLGPNALRLMDALGLLGALREVCVRPNAVDFLRWDDGRLLLHTELGERAEAYFGAPQLDFFRPDLHRVLVEALPPGVLRLGTRVERIEQDAGSVTLSTADGERIRADAAGAADGIRSNLRQQVVGAESPAFSGTVVYRGVVPREDVAGLTPEGQNFYWLGPYRHGVSYWISAGRLLAVNCAVQDAEWSRESWTLEAPPDEAAQAFDGWHAPLLQRIRHEKVMLRGAVFVRRPLEHWSFGRVTLLGDAAHAMEPFQAQGAAQAVEDAYVLGRCVSDCGGDLEEAFRRYERIRMDRAEELQSQARGAGDEFFLEDGPAQAARDERFRRLPESQPFGTRQLVWEYDVRAALG